MRFYLFFYEVKVNPVYYYCNCTRDVVHAIIWTRMFNFQQTRLSVLREGI